jgi:outer membrane protein OmpA-like peptidoglycan-associated protein
MKIVLVLYILFINLRLSGQIQYQIIDFEQDTMNSIAKYIPQDGDEVDNKYFESKYSVSFYLDSLYSNSYPVISMAGTPATAFRRDLTHSGSTYKDSVWNTRDDLPSETENFGLFFLTDNGKIAPHPRNLYLDFNNNEIKCSRTSGYIIDVDGPERWIINVYTIEKGKHPEKAVTICILNEGYWPSKECSFPASGNAKSTFWDVDVAPNTIDYIEFIYDESQSYYRAVGLAFDNFSICKKDNGLTKTGINWDSIVVGESVILKNIEFEFNKAELLSTSYFELDQLLKYLTQNEHIRLEISGHTDNIGDSIYNLELSKERAKAVVDYLYSNGINLNRLVYQGLGDQVPLFDNDSDEHRMKNRRVEFKIIE